MPRVTANESQVTWIGSSLVVCNFPVGISTCNFNAVTFWLGLFSLSSDSFNFSLGMLPFKDIAFWISCTKSSISLSVFEPDELADLVDDAAVDDVSWSDHLEDCKDKRRNLLSAAVWGITCSEEAGALSSESDSIAASFVFPSSPESSSSSSGCLPAPKTCAVYVHVNTSCDKRSFKQ